MKESVIFGNFFGNFFSFSEDHGHSFARQSVLLPCLLYPGMLKKAARHMIYSQFAKSLYNNIITKIICIAKTKTRKLTKKYSVQVIIKRF